MSAAVADDVASAEIRDGGSGITAEEVAVLDQLTETDLNHGSGLGLWLARWIVEASGGSLSFESDDAGTVVSIAVPVAE